MSQLGKKNFIYSLSLWLIWPFGFFVFAVKNFEKEEFRKFIYFFLVYFGATYLFVAEGYDSFRHAQLYTEISQMPFENYFKELRSIFAMNSSYLDIYHLTVNFVLSRFSSNPQLAFAFHALFFSLFYLGSIKMIFDEFKDRWNINAKILFLFVILLFPIFTINAVRWYTALWIFIYGFIKGLYSKDKYYLICIFSMLVHFSFVLPVLTLLIYKLLGNRNILYGALLVLSISYSSSGLSNIRFIGEYFGGKVEQSAMVYTSEQGMENKITIKSTNKWYSRWRYKGVQMYFAVLMFWLFLNRRKLVMDKIQKNIFSFMLLFSSFLALFIDILTLANRLSFILMLLLAVYFTRLFLLQQKKKILLISLIGVFPILLAFLVNFRGASVNTSALWIIGNPIIAIISEGGISLYDILFS